MTATNLLELEDISKSFGEVRALEGVNLTVGDNEIVGLLGDNGAGKSTLIKIVTGFHAPNSGTITWKGQRLTHLTVQHARDLGIETVYQERALADLQSLWRNIFMGRERTTRLGLLDVGEMRSETEKLMVEFLRFTSQAVTPETEVGTMSGGERQGVAIARALHFEAELIILDEPTMGLSVTETRKTLDFVREIKSRRQVVHLHRSQHLQRPRGRRPRGRDRPRTRCRRVQDGGDHVARPDRPDAACRRDRRRSTTTKAGVTT